MLVGGKVTTFRRERVKKEHFGNGLIWRFNSFPYLFSSCAGVHFVVWNEANNQLIQVSQRLRFNVFGRCEENKNEREWVRWRHYFYEKTHCHLWNQFLFKCSEVISSNNPYQRIICPQYPFSYLAVISSQNPQFLSY